MTRARSVANKLIRYGWLKSDHGPETIGCSYEKAYTHILSSIEADSTEVKAIDDGYHLDHNIPMSAARSLPEAKLLSHWTNLQLLTSEENLRKRDRLPGDLVRVSVPMTDTDKQIRRKQATLLQELVLSQKFRGKPRWTRAAADVVVRVKHTQDGHQND